VEITPKGIKADGEAMWALVATAVKKMIEKDELGGLPAEIMRGIELLNIHSAGDMKMYIFCAEGVYYYFAVKTEEGWRAAGGEYSGKQVQIYGQVARTVADAINAIYHEMGVERRVEVEYDKDGTPYIYFTNEDLKLLGLR